MLLLIYAANMLLGTYTFSGHVLHNTEALLRAGVGSRHYQKRK
jgi:hypothetical protein